VRHRLVLASLAAACCLVATSCQLHLIVPSGDAPLRYRDAMFTDVDKTSDIAYGKAADLKGVMQTLKLDLYQPHGDDITKRPAIVWVHGGGFKTGDKSSPEIVDEANTFAKEGYVNVSIDYRLTNGCAPFTSECIDGIKFALHDAQAAVRWLRKNAATYGIDTDRIAMGGSSAGAITAWNAAYAPGDPGHSGNPGYSSEIRAAQSISGASLTTKPDPGESPVLDFHGTSDDLVPYGWSQSSIKDAKAARDVVEQVVWDGDGHVPYAKHRTEILDDTRNFFYATLDCAHAAQ
jgi:acetyl esterase/lipase